MARWGIQVPFPDWENWLWVSECNTIGASWAATEDDDLKPLSFGTEADALKHGAAWKTFRVAEIAE